jgi:hypothetical protein
LPSFPAALFGGNYGLVAMFPFLILYAFPTMMGFLMLMSLIISIQIPT